MLAVLMFLFITGMQAQTVTPSKKYITKELNNVSNFSSIKVLGSTDVEYRQSSGSKTEISIYGSDNLDRKSTRLNSSHPSSSRMPSSA